MQKIKYFNCLWVTAIYILAWYLQQQFAFNWDVNRLVYEAELIMQGGNYVTDFFSPNLPMILYLNYLPILISKYLQLNIIPVFQIYLFFIITITMGFCSYLLKKIIAERKLYLWMLGTLLTVLLIVPFHQFGQREHFFVIFIVPYLLLIIARDQQAAINPLFALTIGFWMTLGLAIKPQFFILLLLVECYYMVKQWNFLAWARYEILSCAFLTGLYVIDFLVFYPRYIHDVLPYLTAHYYKSIGVSPSQLFHFTFTNFCIIFSSLFYLFQKKNAFTHVFYIAVIGGYLIFLSQGNLLYYHMIPLFSFTLILLSFYLYQLPQTNTIFLALPGLGLITFALMNWKSLWIIIVFLPTFYFVFLFFLSLVILSFAKTHKSWRDLTLASLNILILTFIFYELLSLTPVFEYSFSLTTMFYLLMLSFNLGKTILRNIIISTTTFLLLIYPVFACVNFYHFGMRYKEMVLTKLIDFMHTQPAKQSIYVFSISGDFTSPLYRYTQSTYSQKLDCLWEANVIAQIKKLSGNLKAREFVKNNNDPLFFLNIVSNDLHEHKPDLIFVDDAQVNVLIQGEQGHLDFLSYFLENENFKKEWQSYRYLTTIQNDAIFSRHFKLLVYKRMS